MTDSKTVVEDLATWLTAVWDEEADEPAPHHLGCDSVRDGGRAGLLPCDCGYPAQMLARIAADRKILALHAGTVGECSTCCGEPYCEAYWDGVEETVVWQRAALAWPCPTIRLKAEQYADRPGFNPAWLVERQGVEG